jgi:hypothetical protein
MFHNPALRDAFRRAERDYPDYGGDLDEWSLDDESATAEIVRPRILQGGAAERVRELEVA